MNRNLIPPPGVVPIEGLVIKEPEAGIFYMNRNTDIVFQRESELHLAPTVELIRMLYEGLLGYSLGSTTYFSITNGSDTNMSHPAKAKTRGVTSWVSSQHNGVNNRENYMNKT
ncbi:hypothetical protein Tco_1321399 [Tanacetum coccineum]